MDSLIFVRTPPKVINTGFYLFSLIPVFKLLDLIISIVIFVLSLIEIDPFGVTYYMLGVVL